ncbi:peptidoglycan-binding domain-containing protein [Hyphomicrobium sp.]|uniref:peptidoglycan-binding domain-containing protein n=1 Tax=Hyphomicrobium sp. TaxID=82 RepID=UPI0025C5EAB0|nr:peptidoglycan-binding domain-containing protein [Hyphomicrobium sp.]MCC7254008.1 peptidoglycan-binding protein [Hyphomicrobium sp.]
MAGRLFAIALLCFLGMSVSIDRAAAQSRTARAIGAGIAGALILNELSKGSGKRKSATSRRSKRSVATRASKPSKPSKQQARKKKTYDSDEGVVAAKSDTSESGMVNQNITTGSTASVQGASALISSPDEIKAAQQHLRFMGYDIAQETGTVDAKTKSAVMQFQDSIGAPVTGDLTIDQLQMLFVKVASKREGS